MIETQKLHLGCFDRVHPGWINTDITPHIHLARVPGLAFLLHKAGYLSDLRYKQHRSGIFRRIRYLDVSKRFPFPDGMFDYVYSSHMMEHLHREDALFCLREVHRVLKQGGVVRIVVPDLLQCQC